MCSTFVLCYNYWNYKSCIRDVARHTSNAGRIVLHIVVAILYMVDVVVCFHMQVNDFNEDEFARFILSLVINGRQRRQTLSDFAVVFIDPTPRINNGSLEVSFIVVDAQGRVLSGVNLLSEIQDNEDDLLNAVS